MKTIFWNVDTQKDFINEDGKLTIPGANKIKTNLFLLTLFAATNGIQVVNTQDIHTKDDAEIEEDRPDFKTTFFPHCMLGTDGANFINETNPSHEHSLVIWHNEKYSQRDAEIIFNRNIILLKNKFDIFEGNQYTLAVLNQLKPDNIVVYGVASDVCVDYAVIGLIEHTEADIYVATDAIKELPNCNLGELYYKWRSKGAMLVDTDFVIKEKRW